jgi:hypothetical protein
VLRGRVSHLACKPPLWAAGQPASLMFCDDLAKGFKPAVGEGDGDEARNSPAARRLAVVSLGGTLGFVYGGATGVRKLPPTSRIRRPPASGDRRTRLNAGVEKLR